MSYIAFDTRYCIKNLPLNTISKYAIEQSTSLTWKSNVGYGEIEFLKQSIEELSNNLIITINELGSLTCNTDDKKYDVYYNNYITKLKDYTWKSYQSHRQSIQTIEENNLSDLDYTKAFNSIDAGHNIDNIIPEF